MRDELLAAVYAEPDSDEPRIVLADYLLQEGDPRGDFIAKQLAGDDAGAEALLARHGAEWLGSLRPFTRRVQFRRGFPTRLELVEIVRPGRIDLAALADDPALGTIEDLLIGRAHHDVYGALIASPRMTALRRIEVTHARVVTALRKSRAKITHLAHAVRDRNRLHGVDEGSLRDIVELCERRFEVTSLAINGGSVDLVLASPLGERLTALALTTFASELPRLLPRLPRRVAVTLVPHPGLEPCFASPPHSYSGAIDLVRDSPSMVARAWGPWGHRAARGFLQYLPGLARVELHGRPDQLDELERAAKLFHVEVAVLPELPRDGYIEMRLA